MSPPRGRGLGARLLLSQTAVLVAGALTTVVVAAVVGPPLFREHLRRAGVSHNSGEQFHAEQAYRYATAISVGVALAAAIVTALVVTWYFSRRLRRSLSELSDAARDVAEGHYQVRVASPGLGSEFEAVTTAFNTMAKRLESVEATRRRLLGDLAHEIRNPVAVLDAYMEAIEDGVKRLDPETAALLRDQTARLVRFSEDAAALSRLGDGQASLEPAPMNVETLLSTAVALVADRCAAQGITLISRIQPGLPEVSGDRHRLGQVVANLFDNAIRHTPGGGTITVAADAVGDQVIISVADSGEGIAAEHLDHVFERFYRADPSRRRAGGGTGIGLTIVKAIVEAHGGRVGVRSAGPGAGATFTVTLPVRTDNQA